MDKNNPPPPATNRVDTLRTIPRDAGETQNIIRNTCLWVDFSSRTRTVTYAGIPKGPGHYAEGRIPIGGGAVRWSLARGAPSLARGRRHRREGRHRWSQGHRHWLKGRHYWRKRRRAAVTGWRELFFNEESPNEVPDDYHVLNDVWNGPSRTIHIKMADGYAVTDIIVHGSFYQRNMQNYLN